jgi:hypothetical protein
VRTPFITAAGMLNTLGIFPYFAATRATGASCKSIPACAAGTFPVGLSIGFPFTFRAVDMNIVHPDLINFFSKYFYLKIKQVNIAKDRTQIFYDFYACIMYTLLLRKS